jgi:hypothetical protein
VRIMLLDKQTTEVEASACRVGVKKKISCKSLCLIKVKIVRGLISATPNLGGEIRDCAMIWPSKICGMRVSPVVRNKV